MHIGFLTSEYPSLSTSCGGIATSVKNLATVLIQGGHQVSVFLYGQDKDDMIEIDKIKIFRIQNKNFKGISWLLTRNKIRKIINHEVDKNNLQLIEAADWTGITAFMKLNCPILLKLHGSDGYFCHIEGRKQKYKNFLLEKIALKSADAIVSVSNYTAELTKKIFGVKCFIKVIHNGIDPNVFKTTNHTDSIKGRLLYFGTLIRKKGVLELPHIFNRVIENYPEATLFLIGGDSFDIKTGSSSTWELMKPLFSEKALKHTHYIGKVPYNEMQTHIKQAEICVFPSFAEAFPISWLEGMAMAKPIVGSDEGWAREAIENGTSGLLCNPVKHQEYAKGIERILNDRSYGHRLGVNARIRIEKLFDANTIANKNVQFYQSVIEGKK